MSCEQLNLSSEGIELELSSGDCGLTFIDDGVALSFGPLACDISMGDILSNINPQLQILIDEAAASITYVGFSQPGTATDAASWRIFRLDESGDPELVKQYASGSTNFNQVWDNRAALLYS